MTVDLEEPVAPIERGSSAEVGSSSRDAESIGLRRWTGWLRRTGGHGVWIAVWSVAAWAGTAWSPMLFDRPIVLMMLAPRAAFVVLAAPHLDLLSFVALGTFRLSVTDASWFVVGRRFPDATHQPRPRRRRRGFLQLSSRFFALACRWLCGQRLLAGTFLFFRPSGRYLGVAGANGVGARLAGATSILGTVVYLVAVHLGIGAVL